MNAISEIRMDKTAFSVVALMDESDEKEYWQTRTPRATRDMDIWIAIHPRNAEKVVATLKEFGFALPDLSPNMFLQEERIIRMVFRLFASKFLRRFQV